MDAAVRKYLELSTAHMPGPDHQFGPLRSSPTEYGFVVWMMESVDIDELPLWFVQIYSFASLNDCSLIEFDRDNDTVDLLPQYDW